MKKVFLSLSCLGLIFVIGLSPEQQAEAATSHLSLQTTKAKSADASKKVVITKESVAKGQKLIAASDCMTCHKIDRKVLGPSYQDIANKYPATKGNIDYLAGKIIKGGKGVWGQIPMSAHPSVSEADAKEMAKYILSLKK